MATPEERARYIRFQLETLGERNGHHEFEHICRRVAAARIASNLLPATGPVSSGGDKGRDFETHPTELPDEIGAHGHFLALTSDKPLAFSCTTQKSALRAKIVGDVGRIMATGTEVARVHAFVTGSISKSQREKAIKEVKKEHRSDLVIHDALYLAEQLAEPDLYWVARRYLDAPEEMAPEEPPVDETGAPDWYVTDRERWRSREPNPTPGDVLDLEDGLRRATFHDHARPDLPFWLDLMRPLADPANPPSVRQRARYEVAVAVLRGQGSLKPADDLVRAYLAEVQDEEDTDWLQGASTLLMYAVGAKAQAQTALEVEELADIGNRLRARVGDLLAAEPPPNRRARLLSTLGHLNIQLDPRQLVVPDEAGELPDMRDWIDEDDELTAELTADTVPAEVLVDLDAAMAAWIELARELDRAALYPVNDLASILGVLAPTLIDHPDWQELNDRVDVVLGRQAGQAAVAARCRDRAIALLERDRVREAIGEFHRAKVDWWTGDTLRGGMLASLLLWECYLRLGLHQAAAQHALTVAFVAASSGDEDVQDLLPTAIGLVARSEYDVGAWIGATELTWLSLVSANALLEGGIDPEDEGLTGLVVHAGMTAAAAQVMVPCALEAVRNAQERFHLDELLGGNPLKLGEEALEDPREWDRRAVGQLSGPPFADLADEYVLRFSALGTRWIVRANASDRSAVRAAERLAAAAQVLLVELADEDLCLMPATIDIIVTPTEATSTSVSERAEWRPSSSGRHWKFPLTAIREPVADAEVVAKELLVALTMVLLDASLLQFSLYREALHRAFERGLSHKLMFGRPYDELRMQFEDPKLRKDIPSDCRRPEVTEMWEPAESDQLPWLDGPGPGYNEEDAMGNARARCEKAGARLPRQLKMLREEDDFRRVVADLRQRGWRDHHILSSVMNITINHRAGVAGIDLRDQEVATELMNRPETKESPLVPCRVFTLDAMEQARRFALPAVLKTWDLTLHSPSPDLDAVEKVLAERYAYWDADSPYDGDLLPPT